MPTVRKLAPEEVQLIQNKGKGQRRLIEEQYDAFLSELGEEEKRLKVSVSTQMPPRHHAALPAKTMNN